MLNRWVLGFFHGGTLAAMKARIADDRFEGLDEDGQTKFFHELVRGLFDPSPAKKVELEDRHVLFMEDGPQAYLTKMFGRMV